MPSKITKCFSRMRSSFLLLSFASFLWLLLRTGRKPSRIAYPCQRAAAAQSLVLVVAVPHLVRKVLSFLSRLGLRWTIWRLFPVMSLAFVAAWGSSLTLDYLQTVKNKKRLLQIKTSLSKPFPEQETFAAAAAATAFPHRVVMVHDSRASSWKDQSPDYWNMIDQTVVDGMVYTGLMRLTGQSSISQAWRALIPDYQPHQKIAIKVNNNNVGSSSNCGPDVYNRQDSNSNDSNAIIEPVNAIAKTLLEAFGPDILPNDIWVYESYRCFYKSTFMDRALDGIQFFSAIDDPEMPAEINRVGFSGVGTDATVTFRFDPAITLALNDAVVNADYLINIPIVRKHGAPTWYGSATLSFKNHFGSIQPSGGPTFEEKVHGARGYRTNNCLVDIYMNSNIKNKTVLILGDAIIGSRDYNYLPPDPWLNRFPVETTPEMLFFAVDPVAADSVMADLLFWERGHEDVEITRNYMLEAMEMGLGVAEVGTWTGTDYPDVNMEYNNIDFVHIRLPIEQLFGDLNNDGNINAGDAILALRMAAGLEIGNPPHQPTAEELAAGDVNCDGLNNAGDAILILRKAAGLLSAFPCT